MDEVGDDSEGANSEEDEGTDDNAGGKAGAKI